MTLYTPRKSQTINRLAVKSCLESPRHCGIGSKVTTEKATSQVRATFRTTKEQISVGLIAVYKQPQQWTTDIKSNIREKSGGGIARHVQQTFSVLPEIKELFKSGENEENAIISPGS
ncbi:hypothetical protein TNCV_4389041 [Trichonephila clavipes]|nr:hypothetical protein TNCV_4389041 [Trichonephila clavipes]